MDPEVTRMVSRVAEAARREVFKSPEIIQRTKAVRYPLGGVDIYIFEVQSNATGDGVYVCRREKLLSAKWSAQDGSDKFAELSEDEYEVLNLLEYDPEAAQHNLSAGDEIAAWRMTDDGSNSRWVGIALVLTGEVYGAVTTEGAGSDNTITATVEGGIGAKTISCDITGGSALNAALPLLKSGQHIGVFLKSGTWHCTTPFQTIDTNQGLEFSSDKLAVKLDTSELQFESGEISTKLAECS